jgi:uncharacterized protein (TIGR03083 family)
VDRTMWQWIHAERNALADDLDLIRDDQWSQPSLCGRWTVEDVVAHLTATAMMTPPRFLVSFAGSRFSFSVFADKEIGRHRGSTPRETLGQFRAVAARTTAPPGPGASWIGEAVVHAEDIRRPLGISHSYSMDAMRRTADFYSGSNAIIGSKSRIAGMRMEANDTDWATGAGPLARGPMLALLMTMAGRRAFLDDLTGEGVTLLRERP